MYWPTDLAHDTTVVEQCYVEQYPNGIQLYDIGIVCSGQILLGRGCARILGYFKRFNISQYLISYAATARLCVLLLRFRWCNHLGLTSMCRWGLCKVVLYMYNQKPLRCIDSHRYMLAPN